MFVSKEQLAKHISDRKNKKVDETDISDTIPLEKGVLAVVRENREKFFFSWDFLRKHDTGKL